jgi:carbamoyl-phosphate synthase small subunit
MQTSIRFSSDGDAPVERPPARLAFSDGTVLEGRAVGRRGTTGGELCFNTSMTGYQEILTDPSYHGQLMTMTYPHIGNYGASEEALEADAPMVAGLVVRSFSEEYSNPLADESLEAWMQRHGLVGITGVDTRFLVRHIREEGVMNAVISSEEELSEKELIEKAEDWPSMNGLELASKVTTPEAYDFCEADEGPRIAVYDFGVKKNILRTFRDRGCAVRVVPAEAPLDEVLAWRPDGLFLSNGPGDPRAMPEGIALAKEATESGLPVFGICLGHQLMSLARGLEVYKMHVGHRGANHPVKNLRTGKVEVTTQNHGFAVDEDSVDDAPPEVTHRNLNDDTVEGLRFKQFDGLSLQYHPEASPGPHDSRYLFDEFLTMVEEGAKARPADAPAPGTVTA